MLLNFYHVLSLCDKTGRSDKTRRSTIAYIIRPSLFLAAYSTVFWCPHLRVCHSLLSLSIHLSRLVGKPTICIGENKDADQRLCFRYSDSTIPPRFNSKISSFQPAAVTVQAGLCPTSLETTMLVFPRGGSFITKLSLFSTVIWFWFGVAQLLIFYSSPYQKFSCVCCVLMYKIRILSLACRSAFAIDYTSIQCKPILKKDMINQWIVLS